jgi:hypothetical protein
LPIVGFIIDLGKLTGYLKGIILTVSSYIVNKGKKVFLNVGENK